MPIPRKGFLVVSFSSPSKELKDVSGDRSASPPALDLLDHFVNCQKNAHDYTDLWLGQCIACTLSQKSSLMMRSGTRYLFPLIKTSSTATLSCVDNVPLSMISMFPLLTCPGRTTSITVRFCLGTRFLIRCIPILRTRMVTDEAKRAYECVIHVVRAHPFLIQWGHD